LAVVRNEAVLGAVDRDHGERARRWAHLVYGAGSEPSRRECAEHDPDPGESVGCNPARQRVRSEPACRSAGGEDPLGVGLILGDHGVDDGGNEVLV
jgi:hypothetical protein